MRSIAVSTVLITGFLTLALYSILNYFLFGDFGFVPAGRIVFASKYGYFDYLLLPLGILVGMFIYRGNTSDKTFMKLFVLGGKTSIMAALFFSAFIFIYLEFVDPDYFQKLIELIRQTGTTGRVLSSFEKEMLASINSIEETALFRDPLFYAGANFFVYLLLGILSSALFAGALKRNQLPKTEEISTN